MAVSNEVKMEYFKARGEKKYLKCELYYSLGGWNCFTHEHEPRGYYVSVSPVERNGICESYVAFSGLKQLVWSCERKGKGAEAKASERYEAVKEQIIQAHFADMLEQPEEEAMTA